MQLNFKIENNNYSMETEKYHDISIALQFNKEQPNTYNVEKATSKAYEIDNFIGDTRRGGGCNFEILKLIPHCNGTHTECIGHITNQRISVNEQLKDVFIPATLISTRPINALEIDDMYKPDLEKKDFIITKKMLEKAIQENNNGFLKALIIRTLPNDKTKKSRNYIEQEAPFFSLEAMQYIVSLGIEHLLVDMPSVDRAFDDGELNVHHIFWQVKEGTFDLNEQSNLHKTITEMVYIEDAIQDGNYMLNLQIAPFSSDASPSRPLLFEITES